MVSPLDHPQRYAVANELHARPFPALNAPCRAVFMAVKSPPNSRENDADRAQLIDLLDRFGAPHPQPGATHYFGEIGKYRIKWERHTEFNSFTLFLDGLGARAFDPQDFELFPADWLANLQQQRITSALVRVERGVFDDRFVYGQLGDWFVKESLAASRILDGAAVVGSDFRIDPAGHMRMVVFAGPDAGPSRIGRVVQRMTEIETYKAMSMLGLPEARDLASKMEEPDAQLLKLFDDLAHDDYAPDKALQDLLVISAKLENMAAQTSFRFGASAAYEAIVNQRIEVLREDRFEGLQTMGEFMMRRYDPAMRTVRSTQQRLSQMNARAARAGELLRTQVDVERSAQNQALLESMDRRADLQLRLQKTVEGLSVVAISYYAVSLAGYLVYPLAGPLGVSKGLLTALLTPIVVVAVWMTVHRIRKKME